MALGNAEDLMGIYRRAVERDAQFAAAGAAREAAREAIPQAQAGYRPTISASANLNFSRQKVTYDNAAALGAIGAVSGQNRSFSERGVALEVTQPIYHRETALTVQQSHSRLGQAEAEYTAAHHELMMRVAQRYFDVLAALDSLDTARAEKRAVGRQLDQSQQRFAVGIVAKTDVHEAQASYDLAIAREIAAENQVANAREALREITGEYPGNLTPLSTDTPLTAPEPADPSHWVKDAMENNPAIAAAHLQLEFASHQREVQRSGHYPRLDAVGSYSLQNTSGSSGIAGATDTDSAVLGIRLTAPLYQGGMVSSRVRQAAAEYTRAQETLEQTRRATELAVRRSYLGIVTGISQVKALRQAVVSNKSALEATEAGYQVGTRTVVDVLNTQRLLFAAERDYSQSRYDYVLNTLLLKQAAGQINEKDLQAVNNWLGK